MEDEERKENWDNEGQKRKKNRGLVRRRTGKVGELARDKKRKGKRREVTGRKD